MRNTHIDNSNSNKANVAYHLMKYLMGVMLTAFVIVMVIFLLFSCSTNDQTTMLQHENDTVTTGNLTNLGSITIQ